jgi:acyl-CoA thioesterase FadM
MDISQIGTPTYYTRVEAWECDHNQHWNVRQYMRVFQQADFVTADICGADPIAGPIAQHTRYHRELVQTAPVEIRSAILGDGAFAGAVVHLLSSEGRLAATALTQTGHARSGLPLVSAADVALALPRGISGEMHKPATAPKGRHIYEQGIVQPRETDHTGALGIDWLMGRIAAASNDFLAGLGFTPTFVRDSKISRMGVETKITVFAPIPVGTRLQSVVGISHVGSKNMILAHHFFSPGGTPLAQVDQSLVTVDMTTRRATELPEFLRNVVSG